MDPLPCFVAIVGPTASGKSGLAMRLARAFGGEILSADSMQVYRRMDIGTAKPSAEERSLVVHHLIDILEPDQVYSAALFRQQAAAVLNRLHGERVPAFVAGGTGLYLKALTRGLFQGPPADPELRKVLKERASREGIASLHQELKDMDPTAASRIHGRDTLRIIRGLEVFLQARKPISCFQKEHGFRETPYRVLKIGLTWEREALHRRIEARVDAMIASGWVEEVRSILDQGFSRETKAMKSLGYRDLAAFLQGETGLAEAIEKIKRDTRRLAKRQLTWFRADPEIRWFFPGEENFPPLERRVARFLSGEDQNDSPKAGGTSTRKWNS